MTQAPELTPHPGFQHAECELDRPIVWRIRTEELEETSSRVNRMSNTWIQVNIEVIQNDNTAWLRPRVAVGISHSLPRAGSHHD